MYRTEKLNIAVSGLYMVLIVKYECILVWHVNERIKHTYSIKNVVHSIMGLFSVTIVSM